MKSDRLFPSAEVSPKGSRWVRAGHPWIYSDEVRSDVSDMENGCLVDAVSADGAYLGTGFLSLNSKIRIRLISDNANDTYDEAFWTRRVKYAWEYRKTVLKGEDLSACRVLFGEADGFPGLTVDRFSDVLVTQILSVGMERIKETVFSALIRVLSEDGQAVRGIYERNDAAIRSLEGLEQYTGWYLPDTVKDSWKTDTDIIENGIVYNVDFANGQKTGFFLDQKFNRRAVGNISSGKTVLDCFTHTGSFALNAAAGGASRVTAVDVSESALQKAKQNAEKNGLDGVIDFVCEDAFDFLPRMAAEHRKFDLVILDPPAFTKSRRTADNAAKGYKEINFRGLKLVNRGGYFATASCSHFMPHEKFEEMLKAAASDAHVKLRRIEARQQAPDHPVLWNVPETDYLKFYLFQVV